MNHAIVPSSSDISYPKEIMESLGLGNQSAQNIQQFFETFGKLTDTSIAIINIDRLTISWLLNRLQHYKWVKQDVNSPLTLSELIHPKDLSRLLNDISYFKRFKAPNFESLYRISDLAGSYSWDLIRCLPLEKNKLGQAIHMIVFIRHLHFAISNSNFPELAIQASQSLKADMISRKLTSREKEVLELIGQALSDEEIGERLMISKKTVITHRRNLLKKLNAKSKLELVRIAIKNGIA